MYRASDVQCQKNSMPHLARKQHQRPLGKFPIKLEDPFQPDPDVVRLHLSQRLTGWKIPMTDGAVALQDEAAECLQVVVGTQVVNVLLQVQ
jgi:hypothetical protein